MKPMAGERARVADRLTDSLARRPSGWLARRFYRRKVLIEPTASGLARVRSYYVGLAACTLDDLAGFTDAELAVIQRFTGKALQSTTAELTRLRNIPASPARTTRTPHHD